MNITAEHVGRELHIHLEGVDEPFVARPLPGRAGVQITETYLAVTAGMRGAEELNQALIMAVDGGRRNEDSGIWEPVPVDEQRTFTRIGNELSQSEAEAVLLPAFFWQTLLGMDGVRTYIDGGGGLAGTLKAAVALTNRIGRMTALPTTETTDV